MSFGNKVKDGGPDGLISSSPFFSPRIASCPKIVLSKIIF
jgi:hypothetical protein